MRCFSVSIEKFHRDEVPTFALVNLEDHADIGMVQCRSSLCFALEAGKSLLVLGYFIGQEFQGNKAVQFYVLGFVNNTHPAAAEFSHNAVVRDFFADH